MIHSEDEWRRVVENAYAYHMDASAFARFVLHELRCYSPRADVRYERDDAETLKNLFTVLSGQKAKPDRAAQALERIADSLEGLQTRLDAFVAAVNESIEKVREVR